MKWKKRGKIFAPDGRYKWMQSHAQNPTVLILKDRLRVYFTCRPKRDRDGNFTSVTTFVDLKKHDPSKVICVHDRPILPLGELGTFDQFGIMPGSVLRVESQVWLYYVGWTRCLGVPYNHTIGLAVSDDDGITFRRLGPLLGRTLKEPFLQNSPFVMKQGSVFHMWYSSGIEWIKYREHIESIYVLMHATSYDGIHWDREGISCIPAETERECQTNPSVLKVDGRFRMWFCHRHGTDFRNAQRGYRIGNAWSHDLKTWHRKDSTLTTSKTGWDSQMVCYPRVINVEGNFYMFYSGNHFGRDGFGYAVGTP